MALFQELSGHGRVIGGHLTNGRVMAGGATGFSKNGDLSIEHSSNPFKRHRINAETVSEWEELEAREGLAGAVGRATAGAALPGRVGKAVGAGLGAAINSGHTVRISWVDGKQSIIEFPEKQFMVFSVLLNDRQTVKESSAAPSAASSPEQPGTTDKLVGLASSLFHKAKQEPSTANVPAPQDVTEQIAKLASLHTQGILTDEEFADKKAELLNRL